MDNVKKSIMFMYEGQELLHLTSYVFLGWGVI
jgi:hypothetical protein